MYMKWKLIKQPSFGINTQKKYRGLGENAQEDLGVSYQVTAVITSKAKIFEENYFENPMVSTREANTFLTASSSLALAISNQIKDFIDCSFRCISHTMDSALFKLLVPGTRGTAPIRMRGMVIDSWTYSMLLVLPT